eukprot:755857-Hanusia_phi.AAC.4
MVMAFSFHRCPEEDKKRFSDAKEILPHMYIETGRNLSLLVKLSFELNLRARNLFPLRPKVHSLLCHSIPSRQSHPSCRAFRLLSSPLS